MRKREALRQLAYTERTLQHTYNRVDELQRQGRYDAAALAAAEATIEKLDAAKELSSAIGYARALDDAIAAVSEVGQFDYPDGEDSDYIVAPRDVGIITAVLAAISSLKAGQHG